jgi:hypothetical protein
MKVFLAFGFSCCFLLGFGQEREQLEMPAQLNPIKVEWPVVEFSKVINPNKPIEFIGCFIFCGSIELPPEKLRQTKVILTGLPSRYGGDFVLLNITTELGWYGTSSRRRSKY